MTTSPDGGIGRRAGLKHQFLFGVPVRPRLRVPLQEQKALIIKTIGAFLLYATGILLAIIILPLISLYFHILQTYNQLRGSFPGEVDGLEVKISPSRQINDKELKKSSRNELHINQVLV
jgi:hypothetical protein